MLRFGCSQLVIERADPIVNPGMTPSAHTHQIVGGNSFNFSVRTPGLMGKHQLRWLVADRKQQMDPGDFDPAERSTCTSCTYAEDFSNYWTATVYFKSPENGSYRLVPQMANFRRPNSKELLPQVGGLTVYYMEPFSGSPKTTSFKPVCFTFPELSRRPPAWIYL